MQDGTPAGVRAHVFSYNDSKSNNQPQTKEPVIGFLEMFSPEGKENWKSYDPTKHTVEKWAKGRFFRRPDDKEWVPANSPEGRAIYEEFFIDDSYKEYPVKLSD